MLMSSGRKSIKIKEEEEDKGRIGELPEEILVEIVSRLSVREAVRTSLLSKRWRHVWTCIHALDFTQESLPDGDLHRLSKENESNFCEWVSGALARHRGPYVDEFRVCRDLGARSTHHINSWIRFAISNRIHTLELSFSVLDVYSPLFDHCYTLQHSMLSKNTKFVGFNSLTDLSLKCLKLDDQVLECFLSNCPLLRRLSLHRVNGLRKIKVVGPSTLSLRHLHLIELDDIKTIEICDTNLVSFSYSGQNVNIVIQNAPKLDHINFLTLRYHAYTRKTTLPYRFPHLHTLALNLMIIGRERWTWTDWKLLESMNPKQFAFDMPRHSYTNHLLQCFAIIKNWHNLQSFEIAILSSATHCEKEGQESMSKEEREAVRFLHPCLKVVSIGGYCETCDFELFNQIIENSPALEAISIFLTECNHDKPGRCTREEMRRSVKQQLTTQLPHRVELKVF